jgi:prepilin-type N-terminal cleavage/methylation domain-containing protein
MQDLAVRHERETGFSLIELMVAMVITLIISGAIYGMLASGQSAFRREPALVERQQNIRLALDLISRDVDNAGVGMDTFQKIFETGLNNPGAGSVLSELNPGQRADFIQMMTNDGSCPTLTACTTPGVNINTSEAVPACYAMPSMVYVFGPNGPASKNPDGSDGPPGILFMFERGGGGGCGNGHMNAPPGKAWVNPTGNYACQGDVCTNVSKIQLIRYEIAPDPTDGQPALWRSTLGRTNVTNGQVGLPPPGDATTDWKLIARGIDDLQVQYQTGAQWPASPNTWIDDPGTPTCNNNPCAAADYQTVVQRVRITLSSRVLGGTVGMGNVTTGGSGVAARRGQLSQVMAVRSALVNLQGGAAPIWK